MLEVLNRVFAYKLNEQAYEDLAREGMSADVLAALAPLRGRTFKSRAELVGCLPALVGDTVARQQSRAVVGAARILRPRRVARVLHSYWETHVAPSRLVFSFGEYLLLLPISLTLRLRLRWWVFALKHRLSGLARVEQESNANVHGFDHNRKQVLSFLSGHRERTESLMNVLRTIQRPNLRGASLLCVGPRNEAELLLLDSYGFPLKKIESIDLFSYSPRIKLMDMNALTYADNTFDVYYSSAVIRYSPDIRKSVAESIRVTRPGGVMAYGFTYGRVSSSVPLGSELAGGIADLLALYAGHVDHVYWQEEFAHVPGDYRATVVFRLKK